jgi:hypothetical protein
MSQRHASRFLKTRHDMMSEWRGVEDGPLLDCPLVTLDKMIPEVLRGWKLDEKLREEDVAVAWAGLVGDFIAKHTAPDGLKRGVLTVRVLQPAVHHTLMMEKVRLLRKLQDHFGKEVLKEVRFRHG